MPWFRVDDTLSSHPKARAAGLAAMGLWTVSGAYSAQYLTEGHVPEWYVTGWPQGKKLAAQLVTAGLWMPADGGWQFHQWEERQPTKEQVEADRKATRIRQQQWRDRKKAKPVTPTVTNAVDNTVTNGVTNASPTLPIPLKDKDLFEQFWEVYPRRTGKRGAEAEFGRALRRSFFPTILAGAARYRDDPNRLEEFTKHPSTWLHNDCWADDPLPRRLSSQEAQSKARIAARAADPLASAR